MEKMCIRDSLRNAQAEGYVDKDVTPTMRDGRLVIPVAPGLKRKIKGIVHDESSTGDVYKRQILSATVIVIHYYLQLTTINVNMLIVLSTLFMANMNLLKT